MTTEFDQRSSIGQAFLASIIESSDDAIVSKDLNGIIASWNKGAERIFGYTSEEAVGKPVTILIPQELHDKETTILARLRRGERIEHYETVRRHKHGHVLNISLTISPIVAADGTIVGASKIARDITDRKRAEARLQQQTRRLENLNRLATTISSDLDLERIVQRVTDMATELTAAKFGAFFYNVSHRNRESYLLFTLSGAPREAFEKFGLPRATPVFAPTFHGTAIVRSDDIRSDPRYGQNPPHRGMPEGHLPVVSYLAVPVVSRSGDVIGGLFFGHDRPGVFTQEAQEIAVAIAAHAAVAIDNARLFAAVQKEMQSKELLLNEFKHRVKNTLATVQAIAVQTLRKSLPEERAIFMARLHALAHAHDALTGSAWNRASVHDLVQRALAPFGLMERFVVDGPDVSLVDANALHLTMALHELATNAIKYGALSNEEGKVHTTWLNTGDHVELTWRETGGPAVEEPTRKGFGSVLIEQTSAGHARLEFLAEGVRCTLLFPLKP
jgi:PAS domain S-box-containing protein